VLFKPIVFIFFTIKNKTKAKMFLVLLYKEGDRNPLHSPGNMNVAYRLRLIITYMKEMLKLYKT